MGILLATHFHQWESGTLHVKLALVAVVATLVGWHMRRPQLRALEGGIFLGSLAIAWLGWRWPTRDHHRPVPGTSPGAR